MRRNLNKLADAYNLPPVGSTYTGGGNPYPDNNNGNPYPDTRPGNVPDWAVGTFRGTTNNGASELIIAPDGNAMTRSLTTGGVFSGRYADGKLYFDWGSFNLTRDRNGVRTTEVGNPRNQTSYTRVN
jgi:hypothetical protein